MCFTIVHNQNLWWVLRNDGDNFLSQDLATTGLQPNENRFLSSVGGHDVRGVVEEQSLLCYL